MDMSRRSAITCIFGTVGTAVLGGCVESAAKNKKAPSSPTPTSPTQPLSQPTAPQSVIDVLTSDGHTLTFGSMFLDGRPWSFVISIDGEAQDPTNNMFWIFQVDGKDITLPPHQFMVPVGSQVTAALVRREREIVVEKWTPPV